jgi:FKBP-type peptidyl-prolyl cis-trans isomerase FkpA
VKSRHCAVGALAVGALFLLAGTLPAQAQTGGNTTPAKTVTPSKAKAKPPTDAKSAASYSVGLSIGTQLHSYGLGADSVTTERVLAGLRDALSGKASAKPEDAQRVQTLIEAARAALGNTNKAAAMKFLADNGKLPGVVTTASGLQYKVISAGAGQSPKLTDEATVNYRGSLLDGTEFDSSYKRNQPATFPVGQVIKGWVEALQLMKPGAKYELYIPPDLAYGMQPPPNSPIPPGSMLKFEVELISVKPGAAAAPPGLPTHP